MEKNYGDQTKTHDKTTTEQIKEAGKMGENYFENYTEIEDGSMTKNKSILKGINRTKKERKIREQENGEELIVELGNEEYKKEKSKKIAPCRGNKQINKIETKTETKINLEIELMTEQIANVAVTSIESL